ncbi:hypothetical protein H6G01_12400 [Leptolyngbya sp. FACHB-17]|nr:hypothetical protein [Leptolyngbya sp. FACHB-17]
MGVKLQECDQGMKAIALEAILPPIQGKNNLKWFELIIFSRNDQASAARKTWIWLVCVCLIPI